MHTAHRFGSLFVAAHEAYARKLLENVSLRPTRQRLAICALLFAGPPRHVDADEIFREARAHGILMSKATVYNTLHQLGDAGLIRRIAVPGERGRFDVDTGNHQHFFIAEEDRVLDIPDDGVVLAKTPEPPAGYRIDRVDIVIHLVRDDGGA